MLSVDVSAPVPAFNADLLAQAARRTVAGEKLLFVDDINDTGGTIRDAARGLGRCRRRGRATSASPPCSTTRVSMERVEYAFRTIDRTTDKDWFVFPWEAVAPAAQLAGGCRRRTRADRVKPWFTKELLCGGHNEQIVR